MQATGSSKRLLSLPQPGRQFGQNARRNLNVGLHGSELLVHGFDGCFAAKTATGADKNMTRQAFEIDLR